MKRPGRSVFLFTVAALLCIVLSVAPGGRSALAATTTETTESEKLRPPPAAEQAERTLLTDRDGDGLSDGLQEQLDELPPNALIDVVVTFAGAGNADLAQKAVGPFRLREEFRIIPGFAATMTAAQARGLARAQGVFRVEEDFQVTTMLDAVRPAFGITAVEESVDGYGIGICVVDTGVDPQHEQLDGSKVFKFIDLVADQQQPYDDHGHGTHVAAIAAGHGSGDGPAGDFHGVAPGAVIHAAKVLDSAGSGYDSDVILGVQWCADQPDVDIISMSLGSAGSSDGEDGLSLAVNAAVESGKVVVVAAGNSGDGPYSVGSPGAAAEAVTVGAAAEHSKGEAAHHSEGIYLAPFSSRGPTADERIKPDIVAPGVSVKSAKSGTGNGYVAWSGTSMATPFVSGVLALGLDANPNLSPQDLKDLLLSTARDRGDAGIDPDWGAGLLDGAEFVAAAASQAGDPTPFPAAERRFEIVPDLGETVFTLEITEADLGVPVVVAVTILSGGAECLYGDPLYCELLGGWAWSPDLDAELVLPSGQTIQSECPLRGECGTMGRQETLHYLPLDAADVGTYTVRIWPFADDSDGALGGDIAIDISRGPLPTPGGNTPPYAHDQSISVAENSAVGITLTASDDDGDPLTFAVVDPPAQGVLDGTEPDLTYTPYPDFDGTDAFTFTAHDGIAASNKAEVTVTVVPLENNPPWVQIDTPRDNATFDSGNKITFSGTATDEDGDLTSGLEWRSNLDGAIGTGGSFTPRGKKALSDGTHIITAQVADSSGLWGSDSITITVGSATPLPDGGEMHIGGLDGIGQKVNAKFWKAVVTAAVVDDDTGTGVAGATVSGTWSEDFAGSDSCITDETGTCSLTTRNLKQTAGKVIFTVTGVTHETLIYDDTANVISAVEILAPQ